MLSKLKSLTSKVASLAKNLVSKLESKLGTALKLSLGALFVAGLAYSTYIILNKEPVDPTANSVMITNLAKNSGGSGVILRSSETESIILTNAHVCKVVEKGGLVSGVAGDFMVTLYAPTAYHDLCLVQVAGNLKQHTKVATKAPMAYYEKALISGHPRLLPNVVTTGHYSGRKIIKLLAGFEPCKPEELSKDMGCAFFGVKPVIKDIESTLVTATIMAGSSGSGIYNSNMELTNLVFAGSGDLSYAFAVPFEYLRNFLDSKDFTWKAPESGGQGDMKTGKETFDQHVRRIQDVCETKRGSLPP
jgi:S1-C subfamily serine protease